MAPFLGSKFGSVMKNWKARKTLLIVGEGYDEVAFLKHLKQFPGVCGQGVEIAIKNAHGKGAAGVKVSPSPSAFATGSFALIHCLI